MLIEVIVECLVLKVLKSAKVLICEGIEAMSMSYLDTNVCTSLLCMCTLPSTVFVCVAMNLCKENELELC